MRLLLIEDDELVAHALSRDLAAFGEVVVAATVADAERALASTEPWDALFVDVRLPDGSGLDVLRQARASHPAIRALVLTGAADGEVVNTSFDLGAPPVQKPVTRLRIAQFLAGGPDFTRRLQEQVERWRVVYRLTPAELDILRRTAIGESREGIVASRGCSSLTFKKQVRSLLHKTQDDSLPAAAIRLLRAMAGDREA